MCVAEPTISLGLGGQKETFPEPPQTLSASIQGAENRRLRRAEWVPGTPKALVAGGMVLKMQTVGRPLWGRWLIVNPKIPRAVVQRLEFAFFCPTGWK